MRGLRSTALIAFGFCVAAFWCNLSFAGGPARHESRMQKNSRNESGQSGDWRLRFRNPILSIREHQEQPVQAQAPPQPPVASPEVQTGQTLFAAQCAFCHGRDAAGGETGPDLTSSELVAKDVGGKEIDPIVRSGRLDKGMPSFNLADTD
ncbi:MAG TPA: cytochrome c, partial [Candidatus Dormibacteraeota bacterium]|nr:cytochrome c [Candidatus Dormibacteraeota bacterium]